MKQPPRILIVDDNETNRDILKVLLTGNGYDVLHAGDGEEALEVATQHLPDLILLDIMMPKLDGIEVCRRLKANAALPFMPIILLTAKSDSKDVVDGLDAGADEYLSKPIDQPALVARVKALLRLKALHESNQESRDPQGRRCHRPLYQLFPAGLGENRSPCHHTAANRLVRMVGPGDQGRQFVRQGDRTGAYERKSGHRSVVPTFRGKRLGTC